jgi:hypothetical protein
VLDDSYRHVLSNEPTEYVDERGEQRFNARCHGGDAVRLDTRDHSVQLDAAVAGPADPRQYWMLRFRASERSSEQGGAAILAHGITKVLTYPDEHSLQGGGRFG